MRKTSCFLLILAAPTLLLSSCGSGKRDPLKDLKPGEGNVYYGGTFIYNEVESFKSLYPLNVTEVVGYRITTQIYEGLVGLDQRSLEIVPLLAERWSVDTTRTLYTFYLRQGVFFHDDACFPDGKGREVTAYDFKYCLDRVCEPGPDNQGYSWFKNRVVGADEYFQSVLEGTPLAGGVSGITVVDDYTLTIKLAHPFASFLYILAMPHATVYPKEAVEKYGTDMRIKCVGTGPFILKEVKENETVILVKNKNYWGKDRYGNQLPYLDAIKVLFAKEEKAALMEFKKGNLDLMYKLPIEMLEEIIDKNTGELKEDYRQYTLQQTPTLSLQYYGFLHESKIFKDKRIRLAFSYAIDRERLVNFTLKGMGIPAKYGMVPPALIGYDAKAIQGFTYNPDLAKKLLAEAGYPEGEGFPEVTLFVNAGGGRNIQVAQAIQKMIADVLNVKIKITEQPWAQHLDKVEKGEADFWRLGWIADYPDPENFLNLFYSVHIPKNPGEKSYLNAFRYRNVTFDSLLRVALATEDEDKRNQLYQQADQKTIDDAVVIPLFYDKDYRLLQPYVRNLPQNPMEHRVFREVYFAPPES